MLSNHCFSLIIGVSVLALAGALVGQFVFDLPPCNLCILQRIPFVLAIIWGIGGLMWPKHGGIMLILSAITFLSNSAVALYHSGIERHWWQESTGCAANFNFADTTQSLLEQISSAQTGSCAEIPWADPILGLSMANYNVVLCLGVGVFCLLSYQLKYRLK